MKQRQSRSPSWQSRSQTSGRRPGDWLRVTMWVTGLIEIGLFGLPLVFFGQHIQPFVWRWDPHIYKEYGVARIVIGLALLASFNRPYAPAAARLAALFYGLNLVVSLVDLTLGNVARIEWAVVGYSLVAATALAWFGGVTLPTRR